MTTTSAFEKLVRGAGIAALVACGGSLLAALFTATPMLLHESLSHEDRVWPVYVPETRPAMLSELAVAPGAAYGCVVLNNAAGARVTSVCHHNLACLEGPPPPAAVTAFEIFQPAGRGPYYVQVASRCDSGCCDARSTLLTARGERLDDSPWDRVWNRLWYPGAAALGWAFVCAVRLRRSPDAPQKRVRLWAWISVSAALATASLWHAM